MIYLVPKNTPDDLLLIRLACIDSAEVRADTPLNLSLPALENGTYWLYARNAAGNISKPGSFTITGVGISRPKTGGFHIYPNPAMDLLFIESECTDPCSVEIASMNGRLIYQDEIQESPRQIDLSTFSKDVYLITLRSKGYLCHRRFVKL